AVRLVAAVGNRNVLRAVRRRIVGVRDRLRVIVNRGVGRRRRRVAAVGDVERLRVVRIVGRGLVVAVAHGVERAAVAVGFVAAIGHGDALRAIRRRIVGVRDRLRVVGIVRRGRSVVAAVGDIEVLRAVGIVRRGFVAAVGDRNGLGIVGAGR